MVRLLIIASLSCLTVGCADDGRLPTYPVTGTVQFEDGSPLSGGSIICISDGKAGPTLSARGQISEDGTFVLGTYEQEDGAIAGIHTVAIDPPLPANYDADAGPAPRVIHLRFTDHDTSGLEFSVTSTGPNEVVLIVSK